MKITVHCSYPHAKGKAVPGDVIDVDKAEAARLIGLGVATATPATAATPRAGGSAKPAGNGASTTPAQTGEGGEQGAGGETLPPAGGDDSVTGIADDNAGTGE